MKSDRCPLYPQKRTLPGDNSMSALCQKQTPRGLFDHLVGVGEQAGMVRPSALAVLSDEEIEFRRLHHREVDSLLPLEDAIYYQPSSTIVLS
jgi:hypothetical protein